MAYDGNKAADRNALNTELTTDPVAMGYDLTRLKNVSRIINNPDDNTSPETVSRGWPEIQIDELLAKDPTDDTQSPIVSAEYDSELDALDRVKLQAILTGANGQQPGVITESIRTFLRNAFGSTSQTYTNLTALRTVDASRADALFGYGSNITVQDIKRALGE